MNEKKPIRIFNTSWHLAHQYELMKLPGTEWFQVVNSVRPTWKEKYMPRPKPANLHHVPYYEKGKYDLAILHIDQQCVDTALGKSRLYRELNESITDIPKIVINHGTPFWPEVFESEFIVMQMKALIGDNVMVTNSHKGLEMWKGIGRYSKAIIHGLDPNEWFDLPKEPRIITTLSPSGLDRYYNRQLLIAVKERLKERGIAHTWIGGEWTSRDFDDYRNFLGRSAFYFNPTLESPMPRSRTEAMLSGACVVSLANHGAETFIKPGENGFLVPNNPVVIADLFEELMNNLYRKSLAIGQAGKKTALELFGMNRYQSEWLELITNVIDKKI